MTLNAFIQGSQLSLTFEVVEIYTVVEVLLFLANLGIDLLLYQ
jgi:hypothetical protein